MKYLLYEIGGIILFLLIVFALASIHREGKFKCGSTDRLCHFATKR